MTLKIGIIREGKFPYDKRTPLTPKQCQQVMAFYPNVEIIVQPSAHRCFTDQAYIDLQIRVQENLSECAILLGVKEVPVQELLAAKTYLFFSHTIKKQAYNKNLLRAIIAQKIKLVDYETLVWEAGNRIIGFGRFAGLVGAHYAFMMWGKKYNLYELKPAHECADLADVLKQYVSFKLPAVKIVLCGDGRVAHGSIDFLRALGIKQVSAEDFLKNDYAEPVFVQLRSEDYYAHKQGRFWDKSDFYKHPEDYISTFKPYTKVADIFINAIFWKAHIPAFYTLEEVKQSDFKIKVISDITCDIPGPLPTTIKSTSIDAPYFGIHPLSAKEQSPFQANTIDVQAVSNLPCELPVDASIEFGEQLLRHVLPELIDEEHSEIIERACIAKDGALTPHFSYLQDYID